MLSSKSFSARLSLNVLLIVSILFIVALGIVAFSSHYLMSEEATKSASNILKATILDVEKTLYGIETTVKDASWIVEENENNEQYLYHITKKIVEENPYIIGSAIAFDSCRFEGKHFFAPYSFFDEAQGMIVSKQLGTVENDYFIQEWYAVPAKSGKPHWSEPYFDEGGGKIMMTTYSYPIKDTNGHVYAIATADISLEWLSEKMKGIHPYENSNSTLVSAQGRYLSAGWEAGLVDETIYSMAEKVEDPRAMEISRNMLAGDSGTMRYQNGGQVSFAVYGPLSNGWSMAITCQYRDVLKRTSKMHMVLIAVGLIGLIIMFVICFYTIKRLTKPLTEFSMAAIEMAKGNLNTKLPEIKTNDELRYMHDSIDFMQKSLTKYIEELRLTTSINERMESELNIARNIQLGMLPKDFPNDNRCKLNAFLEPAREIGGDLYDFIIRGNYMYFAIGDVSGKGIPAALVMAITRSACRFFSSLDLTMDKIVQQLNNCISDGNDLNMFVTLFAGRINLETKKMEFCNAGHNPIIIIPANDKPYYYKAKPNLAIGIAENFQYTMEELQLETGSKLLMYTDGVTEAENINFEQFGEERLLNIASAPEFTKYSPNEMIASVNSAIKEFVGDNKQNDDITILAITL